MALCVAGNIVPTPDLEEVRRALRLIVPDGHTIELRSLPSGQSWIGSDMEKAAEAVPKLCGGTGLYYTLNPVRPDLASAATNKDITERYLLMIDVDSVRPSVDLPATDEEKRQAMLLAKLVRLDLEQRDCPAPIVVDSGNGYQLLYRIDLPNNDLAHQWVKAALKRLAEYNNDGAKVDISVHNASRIARLPGTWNRKGKASPDRPHRMCRLDFVPDHLDPIPVNILKGIAGLDAPDAPPKLRLSPATLRSIIGDTDGPSAWFRKALENESGKVAMAPEGERHNALRAATRTLAGYLHFRHFTEKDVRGSMTVAGQRAGLPDDEINGLLEWGLKDGQDNPLPWPSKLERPSVAKFIPEASTEETTGQSGRVYKFPLIIKGSAVNPKQINWLWHDRIPFGFLTLFAGRTGVGKSFVTLDIVARITAGEEVPMAGGGEVFEKVNCLIISEDSHEYVLTPRLLEMGADMDRVSYMSWEAMASFTLADSQMLDDTYKEAGSPKFIVIDPPTNFLGGRDEHKNAEVRSALMGISIWAMKHDIACVMITHCNKGSKKDMQAIDRVIGSIAWASTSRIAHIFAPDPDEKHQGYFLPLKTNIGQMPGGLSYAIVKTDTLAKVEWTGHIDLDADDALSGEKKKPRGIAAVEWLAEQFKKQRVWPSDELIRNGRDAGVSRNAIYSPEAQALPIKKVKHTSADGSTHWTWRAEDGWPPDDVETLGTLGTLDHNLF